MESMRSIEMARRLLGVHAGMTKKQIRVKYLEMVQKHHPDRNPDADPEKIKQITTAYRELCNMSALSYTAAAKSDERRDTTTSASWSAYKASSPLPPGDPAPPQEVSNLPWQKQKTQSPDKKPMRAHAPLSIVQRMRSTISFVLGGM